MTDEVKARYHVEGQTSTAGPHWQIWNNEAHCAQFKNIANKFDAHEICAELNRLAERDHMAPAPGGEVEARPRDHWDADWWKPEPTDPFWMLEAEDGEWLKNRDSLLGTRDATKAIRFPTEETAMAHPARMKPGCKWWSAKATEHLWCALPKQPVPSREELVEALAHIIEDARGAVEFGVAAGASHWRTALCQIAKNAEALLAQVNA